MTLQPRRAACERARVWASLLPDDELSVFEQRLLDAHCAHCAECRHVLESVLQVTGLIRAAPQAAMERRVRVLRAKRRYRASTSGVLATASAAAIAFAFWIGTESTQPIHSPAVTEPVIVLVPESSGTSTGDTAAIWKLKRERGQAQNSVTPAHRTGSVLF